MTRLKAMQFMGMFLGLTAMSAMLAWAWWRQGMGYLAWAEVVQGLVCLMGAADAGYRAWTSGDATHN